MKVTLAELTLEQIRQERPDLIAEVEQRRVELVAEVARLTAERERRRAEQAEELRQRDLKLTELEMKETLHQRQVSFPSIITTYPGIPESTKRSRYFCEAVARCHDEAALYAYLAEVRQSFHNALHPVISEEKRLHFGNGAVSEDEREQLRRALVEE